MTKLMKCPACLGVKEILKMGCIYGPCDTCDGKGKVEAIPEIEEILVVTIPLTEVLTPSEPDSGANQDPKEKGSSNGKKKK